MKNICMAVIVLLSIVPNVFGNQGEQFIPQRDDPFYEGDKKMFALEKAVEDIHTNMNFLLRMHKEVDAGAGLGWLILIADKLPPSPLPSSS